MSYSPPPDGWRTFLVVWVTQSVSVFGSALTFFAITVWLTQTLYAAPEQKAELSFALSAVALAFAIPTVFGAPLAGLWVDRYDRKLTMLAMDALSGALSLLLALLLVTGSLDLPLLLVLTLLFAFVGAFHGAAFDTSYAMLVPRDKLPRANGMMQTIWSLSGILAPGVAAFFIALPALAAQGLVPGPLGDWLAGLASGAPLVILLDALTFFGAAAVLAFLHIPSPRRKLAPRPEGGAKGPGWGADFREGVRFILDRPALLWLLATFTVANFTSSPIGVFQPLIVKFNLAADWTARGMTLESSLALLASVGAVGGFVGGLAVSAWGGLKRQRVLGVLVPMVFAGLAQVFFGLSGLILFSAAMAFVEQAMVPIMNAHSQSIWQSQTPPELQGRVFSVRRVIAQFTWPLSTFLAGFLGARFDPGLALAVLGAIGAGFAALQLFNPALRHVEDGIAAEPATGPA